MSFCIKNDILYLKREITLLKQEFDRKIILLQTGLDNLQGVTDSTFTDSEGIILTFPDNHFLNGRYERQETSEDAIFIVSTRHITQSDNKKTIYLSEDKKSIIIYGDDDNWYVIQFTQPYNIDTFSIDRFLFISDETANLTSIISLPLSESIKSF